MKKLIIGAAFSTIATLAAMGTAQAADCLKSYSFKNITDGRIHLKVESRTRVNAKWRSAASAFAEPGKAAMGKLQYKAVGCGVKRKVRIVLTCSGKTGKYVGSRVINVASGRMHKVYDLKSDITCAW